MIRSKSNKIGDVVIVAMCVLLIFICVVPLLNVLARSLSSTEALIRNEVLLWPKGWNVEAYQTVLDDRVFTTSLLWTAMLTVICTVVSMSLTILCAYPLIYDNLKGRKLINSVFVLTMYFSAGIIPNYLLYKALGLLDKPTVLILPNALSVFNMILLRSFFFGIPESLRESAEIDGAGPIRILLRIYLPLSTSVLATLALFYAVGRWNGFSDALMYMQRNKQYYPIQLLLYNILQNTTQIEVATQEGFFAPGLSETLKMASVMFATVPIILVYPWLQRYFIHGVTIGAIKG
ncbi:MAG: carbohydrate ABC transporter permease [Eubacteriales bacterium]|jgi:putative aldouronate transport system permease protein|nr:carbohydrate ABC transporter permease [Eubacteriales bacterium]MDD4105678.1 carbohydrate ABC transporter permease [Eubacteriales bacterium]NLO14980.1 carbohydrate ABC transporter permease [Clostridiales bacterium]